MCNSIFDGGIPWGPFRTGDCRIRLLLLTYPIDSLESSGRIATFVSEWKTGVVPFRQDYIPQGERLHTTII